MPATALPSPDVLRACADRIRAALQDGTPRRQSELMRVGGLYREATRRVLEMLIASGHLRHFGQNHGRRYALAGVTVKDDLGHEVKPRTPFVLAQPSDTDVVCCPFCGGHSGSCHGCHGARMVRFDVGARIAGDIWPREPDCCAACKRLIEAGLTKPGGRRAAA